MDTKIKSVRLTLEEHGSNKDHYTTKVCLRNHWSDEISLTLPPTVSDAVVALIADEIVKAMQGLATTMISDVIEGSKQPKPLPPPSPAPAPIDPFEDDVPF